MAKNYDPKQVAISIGSSLLTGFADGTFVTVARNNDTWVGVSGASGEYTRAKSNDRSGTITITLLQSSVSNSILQGFATADELTSSGTFPVLVKDNNGNDLYSAEIAWIQKPSDAEFGKEVGEREWIIETSELIMAHGGIVDLASPNQVAP